MNPGEPRRPRSEVQGFFEFSGDRVVPGRNPENRFLVVFAWSVFNIDPIFESAGFPGFPGPWRGLSLRWGGATKKLTF